MKGLPIAVRLRLEEQGPGKVGDPNGFSLMEVVLLKVREIRVVS